MTTFVGTIVIRDTNAGSPGNWYIQDFTVHITRSAAGAVQIANPGNLGPTPQSVGAGVLATIVFVVNVNNFECQYTPPAAVATSGNVYLADRTQAQAHA